MTDLTFGIQLKSSGGQQVAGDINTSAEAINRLNTSAGKLNETQSRGADETGKGRDALGRFAKSTGETTTEVERLNSANNSLSTSFGSLSSIVKTVAASYAVLKVAQYAQEAALLSARYETLGVSMQVVGNNAGYTAAEMEEAAVGMQRTGISMIESRQQALRLVQAHIDLANSNKLARIAQDAAVIGNINSSEAFARMIHGIQTGQTDVLRSIGLNISMEQSYAAYAATLGKSANALTQTEKTQAVLNAVMKEGEAIAGTYEAAMGTAGKQLNSMKRYTEDLQLKFGEVFNETLVVGVMAFTAGLKDANGQITELSQKNQLKQWGEDVTDMFAFLADAGMSATVPFRLIGKELGALAALTAVAASGDGLLSSKGLPQTRAIMEALHADQQAILNQTSMFRNALAEHRAAVAADEAARRAQVSAFAEYEKQVILTGAATTAKEKNTILQAAAKAMGVEYANKFANETNVQVGAVDKLKSATDSYLTSLERETAAIGKNAYERKYLEAMSKMQTAATQGQREEIMRGFSAWSLATQADEENTAAKKANAEAAKAAEGSAKASAKAAEQAAEKERQRTDALNQSVAADQKSLDAMTRRNDLLELGIVSVEQMALAELQMQAAMLDSTKVTYEEAAALQKRIDIAEKMIEQAKRGEHIKAVQGEAGKAAEAWKKTGEEINRSLTDALMRGWENGKGFAANFRDTVKNMFKTLVLQPTISAIMSPVSAAVSAGMGALGIPGMANAAGMGSNLLGLGSSIAGFGSAVATGFGLSASAATTAASAYSAAGMGATSFGLQLGNLAAAIPGWGWAIAGGLALVGLFGNKSTPTASTGHAVIDYDAAGKQTGYQTRYGVSNAGTDSIARGMNASYLKIAKDLGIGAVATQFGYASNTGKDGKAPMFGLHGGVAGGKMFGQAETAYSEAAMGEAASRAVFAALQGSTLPGYLKGVFEGLDAAKMSGQDIGNTLAFAAALKQVRTGLTETVTPISTAQGALDGLGTTAATFTKDFVAAIDKGMSPEQLAKWNAAGQALGQLGDMSMNISAAVPQLTQTTWEMWNTQTNSVRGLIGTFDGSVAATYALSAATKERYATEQQLVNQISGAMSNLHTMFASSAEQMQLSVMTSQQKSNYFVDQANALEAQLMSATDPAKIEDLAKRLNDAENNAWNNLDDTQRRAMLDSYTKNFDSIDALVQAKLGKTLDEITQTSGTDLPALIATAIETAMQKAADAQQEAAASMQEAANTMQTAADTPAKVEVDVNFHANVPGASQVGVL